MGKRRGEMVGTCHPKSFRSRRRVHSEESGVSGVSAGGVDGVFEGEEN